MRVRLGGEAAEWLEEAFTFAPGDDYDRGWRDCFERPWDEVVKEGSPYFPGGRMRVDVRFSLVVD